MAAADADESHSSLPKQNTGGSDALCLGAPPGQIKPWPLQLVGAHRSNSLEIPGWGTLTAKQALFDLNGTLATDGILPGAVKDRLRLLQDLLSV